MTAPAHVVYFPARPKTKPLCRKCGRETEVSHPLKHPRTYSCPVHGALPTLPPPTDTVR